MTERPSGTVTFLFTDIEGSTKRWDQFPELMGAVVARHDALLRSAIESHGGYVFKTVGDAFCAAFDTAPRALDAVIEVQRALPREQWGAVGPIRVRMSLHTGTAEERDGDYFGPPLNRVARLLAGHGGQTLLSLATAELVRDTLPDGVSLRDMGEHRLKDLQRPEHVFQLVVPDLQSDFPSIKTLDNRPNNLPVQSTPLIGREAEVRAAREQLLKPEVRLLTLTGPGGIGKTRLAMQIGADSLDDFSAGVFFVALAATSDPELVVAAIAQALGVRESAGRPLLVTLKEYLRDRALLLVLDNFEQVLGAGPLVADLLGSCPSLKGLVTSRSALRLYDEREMPVQPLALPDRTRLPRIDQLTQYEAVRLFIDRAQLVKPDFAVTSENAPAVAEICHRLDGLPLAIELAAARLRMFPPRALLTRLEHRLAVLTGGARDLPARQQTLRGAITWSHDLLDAPQQQLFRRVSVFTGGCTLEAIETICNAEGDLGMDPFEGVEALVSQSLLRQVDSSDDEPRFQMLETIREFASEQLAASGEAETLRRQHAEHFLASVEQVQLELHGPQQTVWLARLEQEHDNIRAAMRWFDEQPDPSTALRFVVAVWWLWLARGHLTEGQARLDQALARAADLDTTSHAAALIAAGVIAWARGDFDLARARLDEGLARSRALNFERGVAAALNALGTVTFVRGDYQGARAQYEESLRLQRALGDHWGIANSLINLGIVANARGERVEAEALYRESLALKRALRDAWGTARALANLGEFARQQGDYSGAHGFYAESLALKRELGDRWGIAQSLAELALVCRDQQDFTRAASLARESLELLRAQGARWYVPECLEVLAGVAGAEGDPVRAVRLFGAAAALRELSEAPAAPLERAATAAHLERTRAALSADEFDLAWRAGRGLSFEAAVRDTLDDDSA